MGLVRFVVWAAVSSLPQAKKISLEDQVSEAQEHIARHGGEVVAILRVPGQSRSIVLFEDACNRIEAYAELRELIQRKAFDVLIYLDRSRLGRKASLSMAVVELCHEAGIATYEIESPPTSLELTHSHDDMLIGAIKSVGAQQEIEKLKERHRKGMIGRALAGKFAALPPYGYGYVYDTDGTRRVITVQDEARLVRRILVDMYLGHGMTQRQIADILNAEGLQYRNNKPWSMEHVRWMLKILQQYTGKAEVNRRSKMRQYVLADGLHDAIITEDEVRAIQAEQMTRRGYKSSPLRVSLFSGVLRCAQCGEMMHVHRRGTYRCARNGCRQTYISDEKIMPYIESAIEYLATQANRDEVLALQDVASNDELLQRIQVIEARITENDKATDRLVRAYVDLAALSDVEFAKQKDRLSNERRQLENELHTLKNDYSEIERDEQLGDRLADIAKNGKRRLKLPTSEANLWLRRSFIIDIADRDVEAIEYI